MVKLELLDSFIWNPWLAAYWHWLNGIVDSEAAIMRQYIRHPADIPLAFKVGDIVPQHAQNLKDISRGGLCFTNREPLPKGSKIHIEIAIATPPFEADGMVAWCRAEGDGYAVGVQFDDQSTQFSVRMIEQVCHIEHYRHDILLEQGREISSEEAAKEWIERYAARFPVQQ